MKAALSVIAAIIALTGCGVGGAPKPPSDASATGISITGEGRVGVTGSL